MSQNFLSALKSPPYGRDQSISEEWFDNWLTVYQHRPEEISALMAFHDGLWTAKETAYPITRPLTNGSIPVTRTQLARDESHVLMSLLASALDEWPLVRTSDLIALLHAIKSLSDGPSKDLTFGIEQREWRELYYFASIWRNDVCWEQPGDVVEDFTWRLGSRHCTKLTADGFLQTNVAYYNIIRALEQKIEFNDTVRLYERVFPKMQIPAAAHWIRATGKKLYEDAVEGVERDSLVASRGTNMSLTYDNMCKDRWDFWQSRFNEFVNGEQEADERTKQGAKAAVEAYARCGKDLGS
ncbi:hypothetical protein E4T43_02115 [Aureobasidium subglaciale]|nr:hypothetical protein E4T43_02115 [Aureobasidium subglaciale]